MRRQAPSYCQSCLAFILKFLNYLQTIMGVSIIIYSCFMLNRWNDHKSSVPSSPPPHSHPSASPSYFSENLAADVVLSEAGHLHVDGHQFIFHSLPAPWFIYGFMGVGVLLCCITFIGHAAAEAVNGCCLCFYAVLTTLFVLLEVGLVMFIAIDRQWEEDLPIDSTGELDRLRAFVEENRDVCEWVGIAVLIIQILSFLLSIILRAFVNQKVDLDDESIYATRERPWEPLLQADLSQASCIRSDGRGTHSNIWSSWMREKYGHNGGDSKQKLMNQNASVDQDSRH